MIKKIMTALLCIMLMLSVAACSTAPDSETSVPPTTTTQPSSGTTVPETTKQDVAVFEEIVLVDSEDVLFKITAVEEDAIWGYTWKVFLENRTDKELMFTFDDVSVNGFMCDPFWAVSVMPGKKSNSSISWSDSSLEENNISEVDEVTLTLRVYDNNDWLADHLVKDTFVIQP